MSRSLMLNLFSFVIGVLLVFLFLHPSPNLLPSSSSFSSLSSSASFFFSPSSSSSLPPPSQPSQPPPSPPSSPPSAPPPSSQPPPSQPPFQPPPPPPSQPSQFPPSQPSQRPPPSQPPSPLSLSQPSSRSSSLGSLKYFFKGSDFAFEKSQIFRPSLAPLSAIFHRAATVGNVTFVVIGGSVSFGVNSPSKYSEFLQRYLDGRFPGKRNRVINISKRATPSFFFVYCTESRLMKLADFSLAETHVDVFIVEQSVNDYTHLILDQENGSQRVKESLESLVRTLLGSSGSHGENRNENQPPVVIPLVFHFYANYGQVCPNCTSEAEYEEVSRHYGLPILSFRRAVIHPESKFRLESPPAQIYQKDGVHPSGKGHALAADLIIRLFEKAGDHVVENGEVKGVENLKGEVGGIEVNGSTPLPLPSLSAPKFGAPAEINPVCFLHGPTTSLPNNVTIKSAKGWHYEDKVEECYSTKRSKVPMVLKVCLSQVSELRVFTKKSFKAKKETQMGVQVDEGDWQLFPMNIDRFQVLYKLDIAGVYAPGCHAVRIKLASPSGKVAVYAVAAFRRAG